MCNSMTLCGDWYRDRLTMEYGDAWNLFLQSFPIELHGQLTAYQACRLIWEDVEHSDLPTMQDFEKAFYGEWDSFDEFVAWHYGKALATGVIPQNVSVEDFACRLAENCYVVDTARNTLWIYAR